MFEESFGQRLSLDDAERHGGPVEAYDAIALQ